MTYRYQLYKCPICGTVTEIVHDGVSAMICCGKTMEVLDDREPVGTKESHMPVVEATEKGCKVSVGSKLHGMDADHLIEWAEIRTSDDTVLRWADLEDGHTFNVGDRFSDDGKTYEVLRQFFKADSYRPPALIGDFYQLAE